MLKLHSLQTDHMLDPVGFDFVRPCLSWRVDADGHDRAQTAYQIQVSEDDACAKPLFDSEKLSSDCQSHTLELELTLRPFTRYYWRVRIWDELDRASDFSTVAFFETGRYEAPWQAEWIGSKHELPQLRRSFSLSKAIKKARIYASGVGLYALYLNGTKVGNEELAPGFTAYDHWIQYQTYEVDQLLQQGENALGALLGNGYFKGRVNWPSIPERRNIYGTQNALILELHIWYEDGSQEVIVSDSSWESAQSPYDRAEIYDGEVYDFNRFSPDWARPGADEKSWEPVQTVPLKKELLKARKGQPVRVIEQIKPVRLIQTPKGEAVLDFGQNMAGWVRFSMDEKKGAKLQLQYGEVLDKEGNFYRDNMRTALAESIVISAGKSAEYRPLFTFFGFRYVKLSGFSQPINVDAFTAEVIHTDMEPTGHFECSDPLVNRLFLNALWGQKGNFVDIPTDCPQRDERMGWTGDAQVFCATTCMNMNANAFFRKYLADLWVEQQEAGFVPVVIPNILKNANVWETPTTGWADAALVIPWNLYLYYGDKTVLERQYDSMKAWVEYMRSQDLEGNNRYGGHHIGDWLALDQHSPDALIGLTPTELIATAYYAYSTTILAKAAKILGKEQDAKEYSDLATKIKQAFRDEFVTPNGRIASDTQTSKLIALAMDMLCEEDRPKVARQLRERLVDDRLKQTTGFLGTPLLCPVLSDNDLNEFAYHLLLNKEFPGWLYAVEKGATTIWERWNSIREDGSFGPVSMNSFNHYAYGSIAEWMYRYVAGINPVEDAPGFRKIRIKPRPNSLLDHAQATLISPYGLIKSAWEIKVDKLVLDIHIPFNTEAEIHLPAVSGNVVLENGKKVSGNTHTRGSGTWRYEYSFDPSVIHKRVPELVQFS